jgi:hypothetical protein
MASCAPSAPNPNVQKSTTPPLPASNGTVLSMRQISPSAGSEPWRAALLAAAARTNSASERSTSLVEFIVRTDEGTTLSFVQDNRLDLHPGDRIVIRREVTAQLARPG